MAMSESTHTAQGGEHEATTDGLDWTVVFENADLDYGHASRMDVIGALILSGQKPEGADENQVFSDAVEVGDLEQHNGGFHIAGYEPAPELASDTMSEETHNETGITNEKEVSGSEETVEVPLEEWEETQERLEVLENRFLTVLDAVGELTDSKRGSQVIVDELPENARKMNSRVERQSRTISAVSNQLDDIGSVVGDKKLTREDRIFALQKHVVEMSRENGGSFAMDYNAVQSFFRGKDSKISPSYASQLLTAAIGGHHAFFERKSNGGNKQIAVKLDKIEEGSFFSVKKDSAEEGA